MFGGAAGVFHCLLLLPSAIAKSLAPNVREEVTRLEQASHGKGRFVRHAITAVCVSSYIEYVCEQGCRREEPQQPTPGSILQSKLELDGKTRP